MVTYTGVQFFRGHGVEYCVKHIKLPEEIVVILLLKTLLQGAPENNTVTNTF